jgi:hypothetical protein
MDSIKHENAFLDFAYYNIIFLCQESIFFRKSKQCRGGFKNAGYYCFY